MMAADQQPSPLFVGEGDDASDDDISVTSTDDEANDEDKEYVVDAILAERPSKKPGRMGQMEYLIKWEDYTMDQSTWEPLENLSDELQRQWEEQRKQEMMGMLTPFSLEVYEEAINDAARIRAAKHRRRNAKRRKLGLPLTEPLPEDYEYASYSADAKEEPGSSDEATKLDDIDSVNAGKQSTPKAIKQTTFKGIPSTKPALTQAQNSTVKSPKSRQSSTTSSVQVQSSTKTPKDTPSTTGYQGTARRPSGTGQSTDRAFSPVGNVKPSSNLANKFNKRLTATRTHQPPKPVATRRVSGGQGVAVTKSRKKRTNLKDAMIDPTKAPRKFNQLSKINMLKKKGQELNDAAPSHPSSIPASFIIQGDQPKKSQSYDQPEDPSARKVVPYKPKASTVQTPSAIAPPTGPKKDRKGKSVRFMDEPSVLFDEPMEIDSPSPLSPTPEFANPATAPASATRRLSLQTYSETRTTPQVVARDTSFGPEGSQVVRVLFSNIPRRNDSWVSQFIAEEPLHFRDTCTCADFFSQSLHASDKRLASGKVDSNTDAPALDVVAAHLLETSSGLLLMRTEYSILIYPNKCGIWADLADPSSPSETALSYVALKTLSDPKLRPFLTDRFMSASDGDPGSSLLCSELTKRLFSLDFSVFLSSKTAHNVNHTFFLLYYPSEKQLFQIIALWLRNCQSGCRIFTSMHDGNWTRFRNMAKTSNHTANGTVIIQGAIVKSIRKIPGLWETLKHGRISFWSVSSSYHESLFSPVTADNMMDAEVATKSPVHLCTSLLFPHGVVFLITPSFVVSEPGRLCEFIAWFRKRITSERVILVACADFPGYLQELALAKARELDISRQSNGIGPRENDFKSLLRAWEAIKDCIAERQGKYPFSNSDEDVRKMVWVEDAIDPNDEQSMVNWFAWWATTRIYRYRQFYVLGSSRDGIGRAYKTVRVPNYVEGTVNHPDVALNLVSTRQAQKQRASEGERHTTGHTAGVRTQPSSVPYLFESSFFKTDKASEFREWLKEFGKTIGPSWTRLFFGPVSWLNINMADDFKDTRCEYATFTNWFSEAPQPPTRSVNTYIGFFYTPENGNDEKDVPGARHPWIAVYRPVEAFRNPSNYRRMELLLWDYSAVGNWPDHPKSEHLMSMQRQLIDFVREETANRLGSRFYLDQVFVGDFFTVGDANQYTPVDITIETLMKMTKEGKLWIPPTAAEMLERGWKRLTYIPNQVSPRPSNHTVLPPNQQNSFPKSEADRGQRERIIFHPPAFNTPNPAPTLCTNDLYTAAYNARMVDRNCTSFQHSYRATYDWYRNLYSERRGYNHLYIGAWDTIFREHNIDGRTL